MAALVHVFVEDNQDVCKEHVRGRLSKQTQELVEPFLKSGS